MANMNYWTTRECRQLIELHQDRYPTLDELVAAIPKHTRNSISSMCAHLGLRRPNGYWLRLAHLHFAEREKQYQNRTPLPTG